MLKKENKELYAKENIKIGKKKKTTNQHVYFYDLD